MADIETKMFAGSVADRVPVLWVSNNSQRRCFISVLSIGVDSRILTSCKLLQKRPAGLKIPPISLQRRRRLLALDLDQTNHYSRTLVVRGRTHSARTAVYDTPLHTTHLFPSSVLCKADRLQPLRANTPATSLSLSTKHPSACASLCFILRCAINSKPRHFSGVETSRTDCVEGRRAYREAVVGGIHLHRWPVPLLERIITSAVR
jgi:hypothetical protein